MIKFVKIKINRIKKEYRNINFLEDIYNLYLKHDRFLNDDYTNQDNILEEIISTIERNYPFFWVILDTDKFAGFVFLENIIGTRNNLHSGEITTCMKKEYWGDFTKKCARKFVKYCFKKYKFKKLKAKVFKENSLVLSVLKEAGLEKEAELKAETIKNGKPQDIYIYSVFNKVYAISLYQHKNNKLLS